MMGWLRRKREAKHRAETDAGILIAGYDDRAYLEARLRQLDAIDHETANHWHRVALIIAQQHASAGDKAE